MHERLFCVYLALLFCESLYTVNKNAQVLLVPRKGALYTLMLTELRLVGIIQDTIKT
jgi:hypothetical protein